MRVFSNITHVAPSKEIVPPEGLDKVVENLKSENQDLMNAYEITQQELDDMREKICTMEVEGEQKAVVKFFKHMNSPQQGYLLDIIAQAERHIRLLKSQGWEPGEKEESFTTAIRIIYNFFKKYGISPMEELGTKLQVNLRQSEMYEYAGSEFTDEQEVKTVEVKAPGWSYQREIISRPRIQETFN